MTCFQVRLSLASTPANPSAVLPTGSRLYSRSRFSPGVAVAGSGRRGNGGGPA